MTTSSFTNLLVIEHLCPSMALRSWINKEIAKYNEGHSAIDGRYFILRYHAKGEYILGPIFTEAPAVVSALHPHLEDHYLLYEGKFNWGLEGHSTLSLLVHIEDGM